MKEIKYTGDWHKDNKDVLHSFIQIGVDLYDSYEEWKEKIGMPQLQESKKLTDAGKTPLGESDYYLIKQELEKIFEKRETITLEELMAYTGEFWITPTKKNSLGRLLVIYEDFYKEDENYRKDLVETVKKYFKITEEEMNNYRV